jgi:pimeloyl-ACP methyl ester carboxylesterase
MNKASGDSRRFQFSEDVSINFECYGTGSRTFLCLHGFGASLESWRDIQPLLSRENRVYLIDLKGFGLSSKPEDGKYSAADQAKIIGAFIEREGLSNLTVVGHSYGGAVALLTYFMLTDRGQKDRIGSLVLLDSAGYVQRLPFFVKIPRIPLFNKIVLCGIPVKWQASFTLRHLFYDGSRVTPARVQRYARFLHLRGSIDALIACAKQIVPSEPNGTISRISHMRLATLVIWGENDPAIPVEYAYKFHKDIAGSRLELIPRCGHVPQEERPIETSQFILDFCK